jgi:hypothetical protein
MIMKKNYIKPALFVSDIKENVSLLAGSPQPPYVDAKENSFEEEDAANPIKDIEFHNIWEDAEDED